MNSFEDRKKSFENKFAHDEELKFKVNAKRNKYLGQWVSKVLGYNEDDQKTYILGMNVIPVPNNRFGLCYPSISAILGTQCDRGQLEEKRCYVRYLFYGE